MVAERIITEFKEHSGFLQNVSMAGHTSFKIGGMCDAMLCVESRETLIKALRLCRETRTPCTVIGNGTNLLVRDGGIRGLTLKIAEDYSQITLKGMTATAQAGARLATLARDCIQKNLAGLETIGGVPGTVGGAVVMNAGAYGREIKDALKRVWYIDGALELCEREVKPDDMGYRDSVFMREGWIVTDAEFSLTRDFDKDARRVFDECAKKRREKQPLSMPSGGSVFKRPKDGFAGALIEQAGLKGASIGGAQVSELHAGFIVNTGNATASEVEELIALIQSRVLENSGVALEPELRIIGECK